MASDVDMPLQICLCAMLDPQCLKLPLGLIMDFRVWVIC
jgi:hypothetical protein